MRLHFPTLLIIIILFSSCKKKELEVDQSDNYPYPCWKYIGVIGELRDSVSGLPIQNLLLISNGGYPNTSDTNGMVSVVHQWTPCGKFPSEKRDSVSLWAEYNQPYWGSWKVSVENANAGEDVHYSKFLSKSGVVQVNVKDNTASGYNSKLQGVGSGDHSFEKYVDTVVYGFAQPYRERYISIGRWDSVYLDTTIYIPSGDTVVVSFELND